MKAVWERLRKAETDGKKAAKLAGKKGAKADAIVRQRVIKALAKMRRTMEKGETFW